MQVDKIQEFFMKVYIYSTESLKAKFTIDGNKEVKLFCKEHNIFVKNTKKIVLARDEKELEGIYELQKRSEDNGVETTIIDESEVKEIDPIKGIYLKYMENKTDIKTNIYPVPNLANPFLGVHYTINVDGSIKIGLTAIPAFWRENYKGIDNFNFYEMLEILYYTSKLFILNSFDFRNLAISQMKNYNSKTFIKKQKTKTWFTKLEIYLNLCQLE